MTPLKVTCYLFFMTVNFLVYIFLLVTAFQASLRFSRRKTNLIIASYFLLNALLEVLVFEQESPLHAYLVLGKGIIILLSAVVALLLIRHAPLQIFFATFLVLAVQSNVITAAGILTELAPFPVLMDQFPALNYLLYTLLVLACFVPILYYLFCKLLRRAMEVGMDLKQWRVLMLLPFLYFIYGFCNGNGGAIAAPATWRSFLGLLVLNLCTLISSLAVIKMLLYSYDKYEVTSRAAAMAQQLTLEQGRYEMLQSHIAETDRLLHDWRHHMIVFHEYVAQEDLAGLSSYLNKISTTYQVQEMPAVCARSAVDVVLRHYLGFALQNGIEVEHHVEIPDALACSDMELCVVFGNLTENALEACLRQKSGRRYIRVTAHCISGHMLAIRVENSYDGTLHQEGDRYLSSKRAGPGLGLPSAKNIAEQRGGTFHITAKEGVFTAEVLLNS